MDFWEKQPIDGLVFGYGTLTAELARTVHRAGIAGVARHHAGNLPVHVVEYDTFSSIDFVIGKIVEKGYRRIALQFKASLEGYQEYADKNWEQIRRKYDIAFPEYRENVMRGHSAGNIALLARRGGRHLSGTEENGTAQKSQTGLLSVSLAAGGALHPIGKNQGRGILADSL